jgi:hypothetical protein
MDGCPVMKPMTEPQGVRRDEDLKDWLTFLRSRQHLRDEIERMSLTTSSSSS